jgi:hypothetical protein
MPAKNRISPAPDRPKTGSDSTNRKPEKKKLQPFLDSGQMVEDTELEGIGFNPIPPTDAVDH